LAAAILPLSGFGCDPKVRAAIEERMKNGYKGLGDEVKPGK
jgi:hypothetical protein